MVRRRSEGEIEAGKDALLTDVSQRRQAYLTAMDDDFNSGAAISELFELVRVLNKYADQHDLEGAGKAQAAKLEPFERGVATLRELTAILGLFRTPMKKASSEDSQLTGKLVELLIQLRADARARKDFAASDKIRQDLTAIGVTLEDRKGKTEWRVGS